MHETTYWKQVPEWWVVHPEHVRRKIEHWEREHASLLSVHRARQFTGDTVYAVTITASDAPDDAKKAAAFLNVHCVEYGACAGIMNFGEMLLTAEDLLGNEAPFDAEEFRQRFIVTLIPDSNPQGKLRLPFAITDGSQFDNADEDTVGKLYFGVHNGRPFRRYPSWRMSEEHVESAGAIYEKISPGAYSSEPVDRVFRSPADLDRIAFDPPDLDARYSGFVREVEKQEDKGRAVFVKIGGPFIRTSFFRGETEFLMDLATDEAFAAAQVEKVADHLLQVGLESLRRADAYEFGLWIYDDMCNRNGPMFSPRTFERVFLPVYRRMIATIKAAGACWVILHYDGNVGPLLDMLIDAGIDGINSVEYGAGLDVVELMKKYGRKLRYIGGVCNTHILPSGDKKRIQAHVEALIEGGRNGGLVIGTHSIGPDVPIEAYEFYRRLVAEAVL